MRGCNAMQLISAQTTSYSFSNPVSYKFYVGVTLQPSGDNDSNKNNKLSEYVSI